MVLWPLWSAKADGRPMRFIATDIRFLSCAKCGEALFLPETSEYFHAHNVRRRWKCARRGPRSLRRPFTSAANEDGGGPTDNDH